MNFLMANVTIGASVRAVAVFCVNLYSTCIGNGLFLVWGNQTEGDRWYGPPREPGERGLELRNIFLIGTVQHGQNR